MARDDARGSRAATERTLERQWFIPDLRAPQSRSAPFPTALGGKHEENLVAFGFWISGPLEALVDRIWTDSGSLPPT